MSIEKKGLVNGLIAVIVSLALVFGLSALLKPKAGPRHPGAGVVATAGSPAVSATLILQGTQIYGQMCAGCHGSKGQGQIGPDLRNEDMSDAEITKTINAGVKNAMPPFAARITPTQMPGVIAFIRTLKK